MGSEMCIRDRDMDNEFLNEVQSRNGFSNSFIVFVSGVMKGYVFTVISINTRCGNNRSAEVSADVFNGDIRSAKIWFCTDIKAVSVFRVHFIFDFAKSRTNAGGKSFTIKKEIRKPLPLMNEGLGELRVSQTLFYWFYCLPRYSRRNVTIFFGLFRSKTGRVVSA